MIVHVPVLRDLGGCSCGLAMGLVFQHEATWYAVEIVDPDYVARPEGAPDPSPGDEDRWMDVDLELADAIHTFDNRSDAEGMLETMRERSYAFG